jgi:hypothetical protein
MLLLRVELCRNNQITKFRLYFPGVNFIFHLENEQEIFVPGGEFRLWKSLDEIRDLESIEKTTCF